MTSRELFKKFKKAAKSGVMAQKDIEILMGQFVTDFHAIKARRNPKTNKGLFSIFDELNKKWNNLRGLLKGYYGKDILKPNGFNEVLKTQAPEALEAYLDSRQTLKVVR